MENTLDSIKKILTYIKMVWATAESVAHLVVPDNISVRVLKTNQFGLLIKRLGIFR